MHVVHYKLNCGGYLKSIHARLFNVNWFFWGQNYTYMNLKTATLNLNNVNNFGRLRLILLYASNLWEKMMMMKKCKLIINFEMCFWSVRAHVVHECSPCDQARSIIALQMFVSMFIFLVGSISFSRLISKYQWNTLSTTFWYYHKFRSNIIF